MVPILKLTTTTNQFNEVYANYDVVDVDNVYISQFSEFYWMIGPTKHNASAFQLQAICAQVINRLA